MEIVYENGLFRPLEPVRLEEGCRLKLYIPYEPSDLTVDQIEEQASCRCAAPEPMKIGRRRCKMAIVPGRG
jgi:predicted DNA-binding antitoxin AbrB/MazE fold protein